MARKKIQKFILDIVDMDFDNRFKSQNDVLKAQEYLNDREDWEWLEFERGCDYAIAAMTDELNDWFNHLA